MRFPLLRLVCLLLTLSLLLGGCGQQDGSGQIIKYDITEGVGNLDPQFATDETARMIISNTFEGLFRQKPGGDVEPAAAQSYEVSQDGLVYTFHLRRDVFWYPTEKGAEPDPVTAHDFAFALKRLFNPTAPSPFAASLISITNARQVLEGNNSTATLGIAALDNYTLRIRLEQRETQLPTLLAAPYAMPCQQSFFEETRGRYGLEAGMLLYNGPFRITRWDNESGISLRRNTVYYDEAVPIGVEFNIPSAIARTAEANFVSDPVQRFLNGTTDACKIDYALVARVERSGGTITAFEDTVWVLALNNRPARARRFSSVDVRQAVAYAVDRSLFEGSLPENMRVTNTLIPPAITVNGISFREIAGNVSPLAYSPDLAQRSYRKGAADLEVDIFTFGHLLIPDDPVQSRLAGYVQRTLQQEIASPVGLERLPMEELLQRVKAGDFEAAILPLSTEYSSPAAMFDYFLSDSPANFTGFSNETFDRLVQSTSNLSTEERNEVYSQAEQLLLTECPVIPLYYETSYYGAAEGVSGIGFSPFVSGMRFESARKF